MEFLDTKLIEAIGKLSIEVVAILTLALIVKWIARSNSALSKSHRVLSESHRKMAESHEKLAKSVEDMSKVIKQDLDFTKELADDFKKNRCFFPKKNNS